MNKQQVLAQEMLEFIDKNPCAYHVIENVKNELEKNGFVQLSEKECWDVEAGTAYYVIRNDASLIAFRGIENIQNGIKIIAAHSDSPSFKIKENPEMKTYPCRLRQDVI